MQSLFMWIFCSWLVVCLPIAYDSVPWPGLVQLYCQMFTHNIYLFLCNKNHTIIFFLYSIMQAAVFKYMIESCF